MRFLRKVTWTVNNSVRRALNGLETSAAIAVSIAAPQLSHHSIVRLEDAAAATASDTEFVDKHRRQPRLVAPRRRYGRRKQPQQQ